MEHMVPNYERQHQAEIRERCSDGERKILEMKDGRRYGSIPEICDELRVELKMVEISLRALLRHKNMPLDASGNFRVLEKFPGQGAEMKAQTMLAVRHVEDARMRIGKILQYADDGVSILDKLPPIGDCPCELPPPQEKTGKALKDQEPQLKRYVRKLERLVYLDEETRAAHPSADDEDVPWREPS